MNWLDSSFVIDFLYERAEHHEAAVEWMRSQRDAPAGTAPIVIFEVVRGTADESSDFERVLGFLHTLTVPPFNGRAAIDAGRFDRLHREDGVTLSPRDAIIAAGAIERNAALITRDRDFADVPNLEVTFYAEE